MTRVLLFGASGFIGRRVAAELEADPRTEVVLRVSRKPPDGENWVEHDLVAGTDAELAAVLHANRPHVVINCVGKLAGEATELVTANVLVTARLVDAIAGHAPRARLVLLGSAAEYGLVDHGTPVAEDAPANPVAAYGITKLASTGLVRQAVEDGRLDGVALRVFNPVGPGLPAENLLGRAAERIRAALADRHDHIQLGPLGACRDFVDVRDVARAIAAAALAERVGAPVLNVGSGVAVTSREAVAVLAEVAGFAGEVRESAPAPARSRAVDWIAADITRIRRELGWAPTYDLRSSVRAGWEQS